MKVLFDAIFTKFNADGKYGLTALYNTVAKSPTMPYAVFSIIGNQTDMSGNFDEADESVLFQFNLFSDNPTSTVINAAYTALKDAFHKFDLVVVDHNTISLLKEVANLIQVETVWQYNVSFRILIQKS